MAAKRSIGTLVRSFGPRSRRITLTVPAARSLGPISTRSGTPCLTCCQVFSPPRMSRPSVLERIGSPPKRASARPASICRQAVSTASFSSGVRWMGRSTTWVGAIRGGRTRPSSSEWVMITAPINRVETPHEVVQQYSSVPDGPANLISWARAKF